MRDTPVEPEAPSIGLDHNRDYHAGVVNVIIRGCWYSRSVSKRDLKSKVSSLQAEATIQSQQIELRLPLRFKEVPLTDALLLIGRQHTCNGLTFPPCDSPLECSNWVVFQSDSQVTSRLGYFVL